MRKLSHSEIASNRKKLEDLDRHKRNPIYALCDNVRSTFNVGAIFRTSDGAFIEKLFLTGYTPFPPRKDIEKVALGATESVPWEYSQHPIDIIKKLKAKKIKIAVLEITDKNNSIWDIRLEDFPLCLILGNEIMGVSKEIVEIADISYEIPMLGIKQSLNVSIAYGVAVYEMLRKLRFGD